MNRECAITVRSFGRRGGILVCVVLQTLVVAQLVCAASVTNAYDPQNRLISITYPNGSRIEYTYDTNGNRLTYRATGPQLFVAISPEQREVGPEAGSVGLNVTANGPWTAATDATWVSITPSSGAASGQITISLSANPSLRARQAVIRVGAAVHRLRQMPREPSLAAAISEMAEWAVGGQGQIRAISNLPPGLRYDSARDVITGRPTRSGTYSIVIRSSVPGQGEVVDRLTIRVEPLPEGTVGSFVALVDREATVNTLLGGRLDVSTSASGPVSGRLALGGRIYPFRGVLDTSLNGLQIAAPTATIPIARTNGPPLTMELRFFPAENRIQGRVVFGTEHASLAGFRQTWHARINRPYQVEGWYNGLAELDPTQGLGGVLAVPQGTGHHRLRVNASGGILWQGRLADGVPFTSSSFLGPDESYLIFASLYSGTGSHLGVGGVDRDPNGDSDFSDNHYSGSWDWLKLPRLSARDRLYPTGFAADGTVPVDLVVEGSRWIPPSLGQSLLDTMGVEPGSENLAITFRYGGVGESNGASPDSILTLDAANRVHFASSGVAGNSAALSVRFNAGTGEIQGTFHLLDPNPELPGQAMTRRVSFTGLLVPHLGLGAGTFALPQLASPPGTTSWTSPILAGTMIVERNAPLTIEVSASPPSGGTATGGGTFASGALIELQAEPELGYEFVGWFQNDFLVSTSPTYEFTSDRSQILVARFMETPQFTIFSDNFNRNDSSTVGNGWTQLATPGSAAQLQIVGNELVLSPDDVNGGRAGITRTVVLGSTTELGIRFKETSGYGGIRKRYAHKLIIRGRGDEDSGYIIVIGRGDANYPSTVSLFDGKTQLENVQTSSVQFGSEVLVQAAFSPDGSVAITLTSDGTSELVSFGPRTIQSDGDQFSVWIPAPDTRASVPTFGRADDITITSSE